MACYICSAHRQYLNGFHVIIDTTSDLFLLRMASVLVSRLLINLSKVANKDVVLDARAQSGSYWSDRAAHTESGCTSIVFTSVIAGTHRCHFVRRGEGLIVGNRPR